MKISFFFIIAHFSKLGQKILATGCINLLAPLFTSSLWSIFLVPIQIHLKLDLHFQLLTPEYTFDVFVFLTKKNKNNKKKKLFDKFSLETYGKCIRAQNLFDIWNQKKKQKNYGPYCYHHLKKRN